MKGHKFKPKCWRTRNKMVFESGHKTFDSEVDVISRGSVLGAVQSSMIVRSYHTLKDPVGRYREPGHLRDFDLRSNYNMRAMDERLRERVRAETILEDVLLYQFRTLGMPPRRYPHIVHGYILTRAADDSLVFKVAIGPTYKSQWIVDEAACYVVAYYWWNRVKGEPVEA